MATNQIAEEHSNQECEMPEERCREEGRENGTVFKASENKLSNDQQQSNGRRKRKRSKAPPGKPPYSYVALITMAITSVPCRKMTLAEINTFIADNFPYYKTCTLAWNNCIRHCLTLNDCFVKLPRDPDNSINAHYWTIDPASQTMFENGSFRRRKRRFKREQNLDEILPGLIERTKVPKTNAPPQNLEPVPYWHPISSPVPRTPECHERRGFLIGDIVEARPASVSSSFPTAHVISPPRPLPLPVMSFTPPQFVVPFHPGLPWSPFIPLIPAGPRIFSHLQELPDRLYSVPRN